VNETDCLRRFLFEDAPLRGHWCGCRAAGWMRVNTRTCPLPALALLANRWPPHAGLRFAEFTGTLTLQLLGSGGAVSMLVAQATYHAPCVAWPMSPMTRPHAARPFTNRLTADAWWSAWSRERHHTLAGHRAAGWRFARRPASHTTSRCPTAAHRHRAGREHGRCAGLLLQKLPAPATRARRRGRRAGTVGRGHRAARHLGAESCSP